ncbi:MAG: hypothetical protein LBQ66_10410 [Planctomycetaceae bacterium]|nr:hypothetical protein [Planctomycetaceae bacterium]
MPIRFGVQFKLFWFYYAQRRAGRPRSSPSPLRGNNKKRPYLPLFRRMLISEIRARIGAA